MWKRFLTVLFRVTPLHAEAVHILRDDPIVGPHLGRTEFVVRVGGVFKALTKKRRPKSRGKRIRIPNSNFEFQIPGGALGGNGGDPGQALPRFVRFARNVFGLEGEDELALDQEAIDRLEAYFQSTGIPMTLGELNIGEEHFEAMADHANRNDRLAHAFVPLTRDDVVAIYRACL